MCRKSSHSNIGRSYGLFTMPVTFDCICSANTTAYSSSLDHGCHSSHQCADQWHWNESLHALLQKNWVNIFVRKQLTCSLGCGSFFAHSTNASTAVLYDSLCANSWPAVSIAVCYLSNQSRTWDALGPGTNQLLSVGLLLAILLMLAECTLVHNHKWGGYHTNNTNILTS